MLPHASKYGIYLNPKDHKVVRITSPYWFPEPPEWVYVTDEVNATLLKIRDIIKEKSLVDNPEAVTWGRIPLKEGDEAQPTT